MRGLPAGTVLGSGTISNHDRAAGFACIAEQRMVETIEHVPDRDRYLAHVARMLRDDGVYVVSTPHARRTTESPANPFHFVDRPLIAAVNGACITGAFELALNCDFIVASENAKFGDTHSRVGVMPGWGLTVLLPQAIGVRRAREMSFTGNFMGAHEALHFGLVNHVVPHEDLMSFTRRIALDIIGNDQAGVRCIRTTYADINRDLPGWRIEADAASMWQREHFSKDRVEARRAAIQERGRQQ